jgi:hypothetical protein
MKSTDKILKLAFVNDVHLDPSYTPKFNNLSLYINETIDLNFKKLSSDSQYSFKNSVKIILEYLKIVSDSIGSDEA